MKSILTYFEDLYATPMNTLGMGNVDIEGGPDLIAVSEPQEQMVKLTKKKRKHKVKSLKNYIKQNTNK